MREAVPMEPIDLTTDADADTDADAPLADPQDTGARPIRGMEVVVATVSGYRGRERFKLIKLIAGAGANYVGSMSRSITHLVCLKPEGDKYDLATTLGTCVVSHRWFEDCIKKGRRLPEGPYTMKSGEEAGSIPSELPLVSCTLLKIKTITDRYSKELPDFRNTSHARAVIKIEESTSDFEPPGWSDSYLLKENFVAGCSKKNDSVNVKERKRSLEHGYQTEDKHILSPQNGASGVMVTRKRLRKLSSNSYLSSSKQKGNLSDFLKSNVASQMDERNYDMNKASRRNRACCLTESCENDSLTESFNQLEMLNTASLEVGKRTTHAGASSFQQTTLDSMYDCDGSSIHDLNESQEQEIFELGEISRSLEFGGLSMEESALCNQNGKSGSIHDAVPDDGNGNGNERSESSRDVVPDDGNGHDTKLTPEESSGLQRQAELSCVICWAEFSSMRGILPCGHRFCYSCIQRWADSLASRGKVSTCPLCKAIFTWISKVDDAGSSDQKIYSQTIPCEFSTDIFAVVDTGYAPHESPSGDRACCQCHSREPEELLVSCHFCQKQWVHSYCLDPPLTPWTCIHCRDLRSLYRRIR